MLRYFGAFVESNDLLQKYLSMRAEILFTEGCAQMHGLFCRELVAFGLAFRLDARAGFQRTTERSPWMWRR